MSDSVLVVGGGIAGIQAALDLAEAGARVILVEKEATIGGIMAVLDKNFPTLDCSICIEAPKMSEVELHPNIEILSLAEVIEIQGVPGAFSVQIKQKTEIHRVIFSFRQINKLVWLAIGIAIPQYKGRK